MNSFTRAIINIKRQPVKSGVLLIIVFILGTVLSAAISVRTAIVATEEAVMMRVPSVSAIQLDDVGKGRELGVEPWDPSVWGVDRPTAEDISAVGQLPYVRAYDFYLVNLSLYSPDLEWAIPQIDESRLQIDMGFGIPGGPSLLEQVLGGIRQLDEHISAEAFPVRGVYNPDITDIEGGLLSLASGRTFDPEEIENGDKVVVVSQDFATSNNLYIGATLPLHSAVHNSSQLTALLDEQFMVYHEVLEFEIIGIFDVVNEFNYENYRGTSFVPLDEFARLHNRIYMPFTVADTISRLQQEAGMSVLDEHIWTEAFFLLHDPRDLGVFTEAADALLPDFWHVADFSDSFEGVISSMDALLEIADLTLLLAAGATVITLTLVIVLFLRDRRHEIGVYMALGDKKSKILIQFLTEIFLVATVGIALALFTGNILSGHLSRNMLEQTMIERATPPRRPYTGELPWELIIFNPAELPFEEVMEMYDTSLDAETVALFLGVGFTVILISTLAPIMQILKLEPKKVLL